MVTEEDGPVVMAMSDHPPDGLVHSPGRLLPVPLMPGEELWGVSVMGALDPPPHSPRSLWPLTWAPGPLRPFNSSRNCILRTTRGSMRGGYGRPVTITPRPFTSAKSSPSLAWGRWVLFSPVCLPPGSATPRSSQPCTSTYGIHVSWARPYLGFPAPRVSHIPGNSSVFPTCSP